MLKRILGALAFIAASALATNANAAAAYNSPYPTASAVKCASNDACKSLANIQVQAISYHGVAGSATYAWDPSCNGTPDGATYITPVGYVGAGCFTLNGFSLVSPVNVPEFFTIPGNVQLGDGLLANSGDTHVNISHDVDDTGPDTYFHIMSFSGDETRIDCSDDGVKCAGNEIDIRPSVHPLGNWVHHAAIQCNPQYDFTTFTLDTAYCYRAYFSLDSGTTGTYIGFIAHTPIIAPGATLQNLIMFKCEAPTGATISNLCIEAPGHSNFEFLNVQDTFTALNVAISGGLGVGVTRGPGDPIGDFVQSVNGPAYVSINNQNAGVLGQACLNAYTDDGATRGVLCHNNAHYTDGSHALFRANGTLLQNISGDGGLTLDASTGSVYIGTSDVERAVFADATFTLNTTFSMKGATSGTAVITAPGTGGGAIQLPSGSGTLAFSGAPGSIPLTSAHLFVGNVSNVATDVALSGDCILANTGAITCTKTSGTSFTYFATGTNAANLTGTVASAQISGSYTGITGLGTLTAGATGAGFTLGLGSSTITGQLGAANGGTGLSALGTGIATWLGTPSSANLAAALTNETGSGGGVVFATGPTISSPTVTGTLTAAAANFSGAVGLNGTVTMTGSAPSLNVSTNAGTTAALSLASGGTVLGQMLMNAGTGEVRWGSGTTSFGGFQTWYNDLLPVMKLTNAGHLLIGTTTDSAPLTVTGAASISGGVISAGSVPTLTGTCTTGSQTGGNTAGTFTATCTAQTVIITFATTAPTGWNCNAHDRSTPANALNQTASTTTSCTLTGTTVALDVISFDARAY